MNKASFLTLVRQASRISDQDVEELEKLVVNFPYCQTAHLLIAKAAYDKGSMLSNQKLKKAAIYAANRQLLKKLIYTSDATVSLQPLETETVAETPEKVAPTIVSEPEIQAETITTETDIVAEIPEQIITEATEISTEPDHEDAAIAGETLLEETNAILTQHLEVEPENLTEPDHEDAAIAGEILVSAIPETEETVTFTTEKLPEEIAEISATEAESAEEKTVGFATEKVTDKAIPDEIEIPALETETTGTTEVMQEMVAEAAHTLEDVPDLHELFLENAPETIQPETETNVPETTPLNEELLQETLASFDQYLFRPEKEIRESAAPEEDLKVVYPENTIQHIFEKDSIGYWMNSSRLGESLEFKNELTSAQPHDFHPELIWEYNKTHELQKEIKPVAASNLSRQLEIIDEFLKMTPRLKTMANAKIKTEPQEDLSSKSSKINKNLASENFANILVQQGKIKKAIKIYEHLILKIPEKKPYFVAQIEKLQNPE